MRAVRRFRTHPGLILRKFYMEPRGFALGAFAQASSLSPTYVERLADGRESINPKAAQRIAEVRGTTAQIWLNLQSQSTASRPPASDGPSRETYDPADRGQA